MYKASLDAHNDFAFHLLRKPRVRRNSISYRQNQTWPNSVFNFLFVLIQLTVYNFRMANKKHSIQLFNEMYTNFRNKYMLFFFLSEIKFKQKTLSENVYIGCRPLLLVCFMHTHDKNTKR